jgi:hypothetical protein
MKLAPLILFLFLPGCFPKDYVITDFGKGWRIHKCLLLATGKASPMIKAAEKNGDNCSCAYADALDKNPTILCYHGTGAAYSYDQP